MSVEEKKYRILMVDDEPNVLAGYRRTLGRQYDLTCAEGGKAALAAIDAAKESFAVVITDMSMGDMNGVQFISASRPKCKESIFMMLSGNATQQTAVDAINQGGVFRYLKKPCLAEELTTAVQDAVREWEIENAERVLLRDTLVGSIKLLADALHMANPTVFDCQNMAKYAFKEVCDGLNITMDWQMSVASSLCMIGLVTMCGLSQEDILADETLEMAAGVGGRLLKHIPRLVPIANVIKNQRQAGTLPENFREPSPQGMEIVGARLLRYCVDLGREQIKLGTRVAAIVALSATGRYDARLLAATPKDSTTLPAHMQTMVTELPVAEIRPGMFLESDLRKSDGAVLLPKAHRLAEGDVTAIQAAARKGAVGSRLMLRVVQSTARKSA